LKKKWRNDIHRYISGIITSKGQKSIIVNGVADHVHCFIGLKPSMCLSELIRDVKNNSSKYINEKKLLRANSNGKMVLGHFLMLHRRLKMCTITFLIKKNITKSQVLKKSI
jgi:REP element-mobilizing transposase RayT